MSGMASSNETQQLSRAAYDRLKAELDTLQDEGRKSIAERLQRARELGDLSENAEYHATKEEQGMMEARIRKIEHMLRIAEIVDGPIETDSAVAGTLVTLRSVDDGEEEMYLLAASSEERAEGVRTVTVVSPLGQAVSGARVGDTVTYHAPGGTFTYEVAKLEPWNGRA
jgi:transcription elongation factor GreA